MSDTFNKVVAVLKADNLADVKTLVPYLGKTQLAAQCYDNNGDPVANSAASITVTGHAVGNPTGDSIPAETINLASPSVVLFKDVYLGACALEIDAIPTGATEVHVTIMQSAF
ncbi:hypothetical protein [Vibrio phage vB_ValS_PJ32]|nr:hypothetical protein [Vibrio phage vB_ValS_PJ32]